MRKTALFPPLLTICSVASAIIFRSSPAFFNVFLSIALLCLAFFSRKKVGLSRINLGALWLLILELATFVLLLFGVNFYKSSYAWTMYAALFVIDIFVTPRIAKEQ